jgi:hypothetical protein
MNIAQMSGKPSEPAMAGLVSRIEEMNALAESSPGFVWRLRGAQVGLEDLKVFEGYFNPFEPEVIFYNMSVWESVEHLRHYVFKSAHAQMLRAKEQWMARFDKPQLVLWWIAMGEKPSIAESARRLRLLEENGPCPEAFNFRQLYPAPLDSA